MIRRMPPLTFRRVVSFVSDSIAQAATVTFLFVAMVFAATDAIVAGGGSLHLSTEGTPTLPTIGDCSRVDWTAVDVHGRPFVPIDLNHDGFINCVSDLELGA
jgi:hypothetical protein